MCPACISPIDSFCIITSEATKRHKLIASLNAVIRLGAHHLFCVFADDRWVRCTHIRETIPVK